MKIISFYTNENQLVKKASKGDYEAQKQLYTKFAPKMLSVCRQYIKDLHFAEDAMANGFVKVFQNLGCFRSEGSFEGWVRRIMIRECISYLRKRQFVVYDNDVYDHHENFRSSSSSELDADYIQSLIDDLPEGYKLVFVLYAIEGYKHNEIAEMLQITENTSRSQLFKARRVLKEKLQKQNIVGYGTK